MYLCYVCGTAEKNKMLSNIFSCHLLSMITIMYKDDDGDGDDDDDNDNDDNNG